MEETLIIPMQSETIGKLTEALSKFQGSIQQPKLNKSVTVKTNGGGSYKFQYADLGACMAAAVPVLKENGLAVIQTIQGQLLVTTLSHISGEFINSQMPLNQQTLFSTAFQSIGSMITYLKRYAYCAILGIVADEDDDGNTACGNEYQYQAKGQKAQQGQQQAQQAQQQKPVVTGAVLKRAIEEVNAENSIDNLRTFWEKCFAKYPDLKNNEQFCNALFQRASALCIAELEKCNNEEDIHLFIMRWNDIWANVIEENTPAGNAISAKLNALGI
ncbi:MAG: ERF family protein [Bacteroidaceae bacterium]|nr:ERF family protein [Bacteroidaceae bacterium]